MISKWFIGVSAKSKGFITSWQHDYSNALNTKARPSFTKQSALATSYDTEEEANVEVTKYLKDASDFLTKHKDSVTEIQNAKEIWDTLSDDKRFAFGKKHDLNVRYESGRYTARVWWNKNNKEEANAIKNNVNWNEELKKARDYVTLYENRIDFINNKMVVREQEIEIKFMDSERRPIKWTNRNDDQTSNDYCNCCGGAVPSIPQLVVGRYKQRTVICAICMKALAQEADIQAGKISDDILEHYQADRFIRSID